MKKIWMKILMGAAASALLCSGCGLPDLNKKPEDSVSPTPTAAVSPTPTVSPAPTSTPTPLPTATAAPRLIGVKTSSSRTISLTNTFSEGIRELYICAAQTYTWGKNLIPAESMIRAKETVSLVYTPQESSSSAGAYYDLRIKTKSGELYDIYYVLLDDMESARLCPTSYGGANLEYKSLSTNENKTTDDYWYDSYYSYSNSNTGDTVSDSSDNSSSSSDSGSDSNNSDSQYNYNYNDNYNNSYNNNYNSNYNNNYSYGDGNEYVFE